MKLFDHDSVPQRPWGPVGHRVDTRAHDKPEAAANAEDGEEGGDRGSQESVGSAVELTAPWSWRVHVLNAGGANEEVISRSIYFDMSTSERRFRSRAGREERWQILQRAPGQSGRAADFCDVEMWRIRRVGASLNVRL